MSSLVYSLKKKEEGEEEEEGEGKKPKEFIIKQRA